MTTNKSPKRISFSGFFSLCAMLLLTSSFLAGAETVTLPVAVSAVGRGVMPFVSDVRVFNTSYTDVLTVTAIFRFGGQQSAFQLGPREAKAFDDLCVGMFVPGLPQSAAHPVTVLTGLINGDSRTNVGVYNPNDTAVAATIRLFDGPVLLGTVPAPLAPHAVSQYNDIYGLAGFAGIVTVDGYATVTSDGSQLPLFAY